MGFKSFPPTVALDPTANAYPRGYHLGAASLTAIDADLIPANIGYGTTIFGVLGTLVQWVYDMVMPVLSIVAPTIAVAYTNLNAGDGGQTDTHTLTVPAPTVALTECANSMLLIDDCNTNIWNEFVGGHVTSTLDAVVFKIGTSETVTSQVSASADDVVGYPGNYGNMWGDSILGKWGGASRNNGMVFRNINIPAGVSILSAYVTFKAAAYSAGLAPKVIVKGENAAIPAAYGASEDPTSRAYIAATVPWNITGAWTSGTNQDSTDISAIITSLLGTYGPYANGVIALGFFDNGSVNDNFRDGNNYDNLPADAAILTINYSTGKSEKLDVADAQAVGLLATQVYAPMNLTTYNYIKLWIRSTVNTNLADLQFLLDDTAGCVSPLKDLDIPALVANTWTELVLPLGDASGLGAIISLGINMAIDLGAFVLNIDQIRATKGV